MSKLKVSIVIPTYNRPHLLDRLLKTIAAQTFKDYEVIVVDDHSLNEKTYANLIRKHQKKTKKIKYFRNKSNQGAPRCRNLGILAAKHQLIALADDDDEWLPRKLEKQVEVFKTRWNDFELVYTALLFKDEKGLIHNPPTSVYEGTPLKQMLRGNVPLYSSSLLFKKKTLVDIGLFDEKFTSHQDFDLCVRIFDAGYRCFPIREKLVIYHVQEDSITSSPQNYRGMVMLMRKHFGLYTRKVPFTFFKMILVLISKKINIRPFKLSRELKKYIVRKI